jgi:hypothetical protein
VPVTRAARGTRAPSRGSSRWRCMVSHQYGRPIPPSCCGNPERPVVARRETPFLTGTATTLRSCRADLAAFRDVRASLGLCRSLLPLAFDLENSGDMVGARRMAQPSRAHPTLKLALVAYWYGPAVCVAQNIFGR